MPTPHEVGLQASELALLVDAIEDYAIFLLSPEGIIRSWNSGASRTMGYTASEAVGLHFSLFYEPVDLEAGKPQHELSVAAAEGRVEDEGWRIRKDGTRFWADTVIAALRDSAGKVTGFAKVTRDLTSRQQAAERLRRSEEMFRLLIESVKEYAIFMLDPQGNVLTWNAGAQAIKGYTPDEIIGQHFSRFYLPADAEKPARELEIATREGMIEDEGWRVRKDGTTFWANVVITAIFDDTGELRGFAKVTRDMTERKRGEEMQQALYEQREARFHAEEERRRAEDAYRISQEANRAKDEFLMTLSHELRTPLTAILGWSRLLPALPPDDETFHEALEVIAQSAQTQAQLIDDVLDVSRITTGKLRMHLETIDLTRLLAASVDAVRPGADAKGISLATTFAPQIGSMVADPTRLQQIVWNLLTNAVKFTPQGGTVTLSGRRTPSDVQVTVTDTGEGIDPAFLPHIFEAFRQAENPSTRVHGGLGLGLSIVRYLVEAHGGTISVESAGRGLGATFNVTLPTAAAMPPPTACTTHSGADLPASRQLDAVTILLIDDDREGRKVITAILRQAGAEVTAVESAFVALEWLKTMQPDVVITDIAMPHLDGHTFARQLRAERPDQKIIALTAFPARPAGIADSVFDAYIMKPVEPRVLADSIHRVLGRQPS